MSDKNDKAANEGETWVNDHCVHCGVRNWVCMGDVTDFTSSAGEEPVCRCWKCKEAYWRAGTLDDKAMLASYSDYDTTKSPSENLPSMDVVDGLKIPE